MSAAAPLALPGDVYPQREAGARPPSFLDRAVERVATAWRARRIGAWRLAGFVRLVARAERRFEALDAAGRAEALRQARVDLRRERLSDPAVARAFALVRLAARDVLGKRHFDAQIKGGYVLVRGCLAEMDTGEGKSLTATLAAATMALSGRAVHLVTVNDYLARRDAEEMEPLYAALGLTTGLVTEPDPPEARRVAYRRDIVYCSSKTVTFDYLRDRIALGARMRPLRLALDRFADPDGGALLLRGLHYAIVDEADSVLVDEARTPLILSAPVRGSGQDQFLTEALKIARDLAEGVHFERRERGRDPVLTRAGRDAVAARAAELSGLWSGERRREEAIVQALSALYLFKRDVDYIVRDDKVQIVDENTGRVMPDRSWQRGLQQLIELCEGVPVTPDKQTLARISFQLFFRRYLSLAGMTGTCREVAGEIGAVYGVPVVRVPRNRRSRRRHLPPRLHARVEARWADVVERVRLRVDRGQPVLVGTRSIMASEELAARLARAGIDHQVLNAKQDEAEAAIVASAGGPRRVTIATNMAGRGTDIKLAAGVEAVGGLHVILTEGHDNARIDRQLIGRCARQGDPGSCESILSLEDELLSDFFPPLVAALRALLAARPRSWLLKRLGLICYRAAQRRVERRHRRIREELLRADLRTSRNLSFSGPTE